MNQPLLEIVAGPNGSGKSTFAESYLIRSLGRTSYLNPDVIAAGVAPGETQHALFQAGRILLKEIKARISAQEEVGFETTLSGMTYLNTIKSAREQGYFIRIYFLVTENAQMNIARIRKRVEMGGHHIPSRDVLRRFKRSFVNFWTHYRHEVDEGYF
jgi:predicted ABC-type ATPase